MQFTSGRNVATASGLLAVVLLLGLPKPRTQAIELGIVNYLWPCLTVIFAIVIHGQRAGALVVPGILLSVCGIVWVVGGSGGLSIERTAANVLSNPLSYGLAFSGAFIWAVYCNVTKRFAGGKNGVALFFMLTSAILWLKYFLSAEPALAFTTPPTMSFWQGVAMVTAGSLLCWVATRGRPARGG